MSGNDAVRLTVYQLNSKDALPTGGAIPVVTDDHMVRQVDTTTPQLIAAASAVVREFIPSDRIGQLLAALENAFATVPISGFAAVVNVPTRLAFVAVWPWARGAGRLGPQASQ